MREEVCVNENGVRGNEGGVVLEKEGGRYLRTVERREREKVRDVSNFVVIRQ